MIIDSANNNRPDIHHTSGFKIVDKIYFGAIIESQGTSEGKIRKLGLVTYPIIVRITVQRIRSIRHILKVTTHLQSVVQRVHVSDPYKNIGKFENLTRSILVGCVMFLFFQTFANSTWLFCLTEFVFIFPVPWLSISAPK